MIKSFIFLQDSYPFKYVLCDVPKKTIKTTDPKEKTKFEEYTEAVRDIKTLWLSKLGE